MFHFINLENTSFLVFWGVINKNIGQKWVKNLRVTDEDRVAHRLWTEDLKGADQMDSNQEPSNSDSNSLSQCATLPTWKYMC